MLSTYTIGDLSQITRIKPHTLRVWEQRYGIINPQRTEINTRLYCQDDLKYLLNIVLLYQGGQKISHIAKLTKEELSNKVRTYSAENLQFPVQIQSLVISMLELDEDRFEKQLNSNILSFGLEETIIQIVYPFMKHIGILWQTDSVNPAQEHFITNLVRQKLIVAIDGIPSDRKKKDAKTFVLFLPEGELHEISLLFAYYILKRNGHKVIYLGQSLPLKDLKKVQDSHNPDFIFTIVTSSPSQDEVQNYLYKMKEMVPETNVWISGFQIFSQELKFPDNFTVLTNPSSINELLKNNL